MPRKWQRTALLGGAVLALAGIFLFGRAALGEAAFWTGWCAGPGMMGGGPGWMQRMHSSMMQGGGSEAIPEAPARPGAPVVERSVTLREWSLSPGDLQVPAGSRLVLTVRNEGKMAHNLAIPDLGVRLVGIPPGGSRVVELNVEEPGTYTVLCDIPGHAQAGQQGTLTITAP